MQKCVLYVCINFHAIAPQLHTHTPLCFHRASYVCTFMCLDVTWGQLILHKVNSKHTTTTTNNNFCSNGLARRNIEEHLRKSEIDGRSVVPLENSHSLLYKFFFPGVLVPWGVMLTSWFKDRPSIDYQHNKT